MNPAKTIADSIEEAVDAKIAKSQRGGQKTVTAVYCGKDSDGKPYVQIPGADDTTPIRRMSVQADVGDTVTVTIENGMAVVDSNVSNPSASSSNLQAVEVKTEKAQETADEAVEQVRAVSRKTDAAMAQALSASTIASEAQEVADATNQHFWDDDNGAHVTDVTQEEWTTALEDNFSDLSTSKPYHNSLFNSLGMLFRSALNNLVSITRSAIAFYDGQGNNDSNIVASFGMSGAQIGKSDDAHVEITNQYVNVMGGSTQYLQLGPSQWSSGTPSGGGVIRFGDDGTKSIVSTTAGGIMVMSDNDTSILSGTRTSSTSGTHMRATAMVKKPVGSPGNSSVAFEVHRTTSTGDGSLTTSILELTYAGDLTVNSVNGKDVSGIGDLVTSSDTASVASSTGTSVCSVTLTKGVWLVSYAAMFASNSTGRRFIDLSTTAGYATNQASNGESRTAVSGGATTLARCRVVNPSASVTYYLNAFHNAGAALSVDGDIQAIRII